MQIKPTSIEEALAAWDRGDQLVEAEWVQAMPSARAADASHSSLLRVSTVGGIAIAALTALYFITEFLR